MKNRKREVFGKLQIPWIQASGRKDKNVKTILTLKIKKSFRNEQVWHQKVKLVSILNIKNQKEN